MQFLAGFVRNKTVLWKFGCEAIKKVNIWKKYIILPESKGILKMKLYS